MTTPDPSREAFYAWLRTHEDEVGALDDPSALAGWQAAVAHMQAEGGAAQTRPESAQTRMDAGSTPLPSNGWQPIETAPKDGTHFLALIGGLPYEARFDEHGRFIRFIHTNIAPGAVWTIHHQGGRELREQHRPPEDPQYEPMGMIWQIGFDFKPSHWAPLPAAPKQEGST